MGKAFEGAVVCLLLVLAQHAVAQQALVKDFITGVLQANSRTYIFADGPEADEVLRRCALDRLSCTMKIESNPVQSQNHKRAVQLALLDSSSCALLEGGTVKCWGRNSNGQLGQSDTEHRGDEWGEMGDDLLAIPLGRGRHAVSIAAGTQHVCALLDNGDVKCWGGNPHGVLGQGHHWSVGHAASTMGDHLLAVDLGTGRYAVNISAGHTHTCAILDDGGLKCWGANSYGQLGQGDNADRGAGANQMGDSLPAINLGTGRTAIAVSAGGEHTCAVLDDGSAKCWGYNTEATLGQGDTIHRGGSPGQMGDYLPPVALGTGRSAVHVVALLRSTCALLDNGEVKCWGNNVYGTLGVSVGSIGLQPNDMGDNLEAVNFGMGRKARFIDGHSEHVCALLDNGDLRCWGQGDHGKLGVEWPVETIGKMFDDDLLDYRPIKLGMGRTAVSVSTGIHHTCAILDNNHTKCWGRNDFGELGLSDTVQRGMHTDEMGDVLPPVRLGVTFVMDCVDGWVDASGTKCWKYNDQALTWAEAEGACQAWGGHLATAGSAEDAGALLAFRVLEAIEGHFWIGLTDLHNRGEGKFVWWDATEVGNGDHAAPWGAGVPSPWSPGEPNNWGGNEHCGEMREAGWNDVDCQVQQPSVCSKEASCRGGMVDALGRCWEQHREGQSWGQAREICKLRGKTLAAIRNQDDQDFLERLREANRPWGLEPAWIGMLSLLWFWVDQATQESANDFHHWSPGLVLPLGQRAVCVNHEHFWDLGIADQRFGFICQEQTSVRRSGSVEAEPITIDAAAPLPSSMPAHAFPAAAVVLVAVFAAGVVFGGRRSEGTVLPDEKECKELGIEECENLGV